MRAPLSLEQRHLIGLHHAPVDACMICQHDAGKHPKQRIDCIMCTNVPMGPPWPNP